MKQKLSRWNLVTWLGLIAFHLVALTAISLFGGRGERTSTTTTDPHLSEQPESKDRALETKTWIFPSPW